MLSEVISEVAALFEYAPALRVSALKVELDSLGLWVFHPDSLVPLFRNPFESFMFASARVPDRFKSL